IAPAGRGVLRHGERCAGRRRSPWLDPGEAARLEIGDDLAGDVVVKVGPVSGRTWGAVVSGHRGSPRRAPETFSPALNPSRPTRPHSHSQGALRGSPRRRGCVGNEVPTRGK